MRCFVLVYIENQLFKWFLGLFYSLLHEKIFLCRNLLTLNMLSYSSYLIGIYLVSFLF